MVYRPVIVFPNEKKNKKRCQCHCHDNHSTVYAFSCSFVIEILIMSKKNPVSVNFWLFSIDVMFIHLFMCFIFQNNIKLLGFIDSKCVGNICLLPVWVSNVYVGKLFP